jgi:hypothetical protein
LNLALLLKEVVPGRLGGLKLQGQMHALVAAVLLRVKSACDRFRRIKNDAMSIKREDWDAGWIDLAGVTTGNRFPLTRPGKILRENPANATGWG